MRDRWMRGGLLPAVTVVLGLAAPGAVASTGDPGSGALLTTSRPDLTAVAVAQGSAYAIVAQAVYCFDGAIDPDYVNGTAFLLHTSDASRFLRSVSATANPDRRCVTATFHPTVDLVNELSVGAVDAGAVAAPGDVDLSLPAAARVGNSALAPVARRTTGPDLIAATANPGDNTADFTFDQPVDPGGPSISAQQFAMADAAGTQTSANGAAAMSDRHRVHVQFPPGSSVGAAIRFFVQRDAVRTYPQDAVIPSSPAMTRYTPNPDGVVVVAPQPDRPELVSAAPTADPTRFLLSYSADPGALNPTDVVLVLDNANTVAGTAVSDVAGVRRQRIVSFGSTPGEPGTVVSIVSRTGAARAGGTLPGPAGIADVAPVIGRLGHTNAPDLDGIAIDPASGVTTFAFDETVSAASATEVARFMVAFGDGSTRTGDAIAGVSGNQVRVHFPGSIGGAVGAVVLPVAVRDVLGNPNIPSSVSTALIPPPVVHHATSITFRRKGSRLVGSLASDLAACRTGRSVQLRRRGRFVRQVTSSATAAFAVKLPLKRGTVTLQAPARQVSATDACDPAATSFKVTAKVLAALKRGRRG